MYRKIYLKDVGQPVLNIIVDGDGIVVATNLSPKKRITNLLVKDVTNIAVGDTLHLQPCTKNLVGKLIPRKGIKMPGQIITRIETIPASEVITLCPKPENKKKKDKTPQMEYYCVLKNGEVREVQILNKPVHQCFLFGNASTVYKTLEYIYKAPKKEIVSYNYDDAYRLFVGGMGYVRDEGALFDIYRSMRNPIIKLELIEVRPK